MAWCLTPLSTLFSHCKTTGKGDNERLCEMKRHTALSWIPPPWDLMIQSQKYRIYPKYLDTSTPYHICSKIWTSTIHYPMLCLKTAGWVANCRPRWLPSYKTFFVSNSWPWTWNLYSNYKHLLNISEQENFSANKYENAVFIFISRENFIKFMLC